MAVKYVSEFSFPSDFGFHKNSKAAVPGKAHGGHIKATTPQRFARGGHASTPQAYRKGGEVQGPQSKYAGHAKKHDDKPKTPAGAGKPSYGKAKVHVAKTTTEKSSGLQKPAFKEGGKIGVAYGKVKDGDKTPWSKDDGVSPGSPKRTPPGQGVKNAAAAKNKFATEGENTDTATPQKGDVERMTEFSDFKHGGKVHKKAKGGSAGHKAGCGCSMCGGGRISNLGHYAHGGKVGEKYEKAAGTPKKSGDGSHSEHPSGKATGKHTEKAQGSKRASTHEKHPKATRSERRGDMGEHAEPKNTEHALHLAGGGLSRGTSPKRNAAIHAKMHHASPSLAGPLAAAAGAMGGQGIPHPAPGPGIGPTPPGMAPGMGSPPGGMMGGMAPQGPTMGAPHMAHGGSVKHVIHHHVSYKR